MVTPCGIYCEDGACESFNDNQCAGCHAIRGKVFWTQYAGIAICDVYDCCVNERGLQHCGQCSELPCENYYKNVDPSMTYEEHVQGVQQQVATLRSLAEK